MQLERATKSCIARERRLKVAVLYSLQDAFENCISLSEAIRHVKKESLQNVYLSQSGIILLRGTYEESED